MGLLKTISSLRFGFGGAAVSGEGAGYGFGSISDSESQELIQQAFQLGVRIYDTAPIYGYGASEKRIGAALRKHRDQAFLVSKCGVSWHPGGRVNMTNDPTICEKMLYQSLQDLQTDYIDLYMVHWPDSKVDIRQTLEPLIQAQQKGQIRHLGLCNTNTEDLQKALSVCKIEAVQSEFNLLNTKAQELFATLKKHDISFMSWGTFDKGILSERVTKERIERRQFDQHDARSWAPWWKNSEPLEKLKKVEQFKMQAQQMGLSLAEYALRHNLQFEEVECVLVGCRNSQQLTQTVDMLKKLQK